MCRGSVHVLLRFFGHFSWSSWRGMKPMISHWDESIPGWMERTDQTRDYLLKKRYSEFKSFWPGFPSAGALKSILVSYPDCSLAAMSAKPGTRFHAIRRHNHRAYFVHRSRNWTKTFFNARKIHCIYRFVIRRCPGCHALRSCIVLHHCTCIPSLSLWSALGAQEFPQILHQIKAVHILFLRYRKWTKFTEECALTLFTACSLVLVCACKQVQVKNNARSEHNLYTSMSGSLPITETKLICTPLQNFGKFLGT